MAKLPTIRLGDACTKIGSGVTPDGGANVYVQSGVALIRSQNVHNSEFSYDGLAYITDDVATQMRGVTIEENDVLLNITGDSVARCCVVPVGVLPARVNQHVAILRADPEKLNPKFLGHFMVSPEMQAQMLSWAGSGGTRKALTKKMIEGFEVPAPPLNEQGKIADILTAYDSIISINRRRIALLDQAARELYREWFVRFRFPGHEHVKVVDGVPEGWARLRLGSLTAKIGSGATPRGGEASYKSSGTVLFRSQNIYDYNFEPAGLAFIDDEQAKALSNVEVQSGDVLLNITGASVGRCCLAPRRFLPGRVNQHVMIIRADLNRVTSQFLLHAINSPENKGLLMNIARAGGATREALTKDDISDFFIRVPTPALLESFDNQVTSIVDQQEVLANQNDCLARARDLLLPRLMNGSIAV